MSNKGLFERLLSDLKESLAPPRTSEALLRIEPPQYQLPDSFYAAIKEEHDPLLLARQYAFCEGPDILKVMNSGIFHNGGLKWRKISGKEDYKTLPINDLSFFILEVTTRLVMPEWDELMINSVSAFDVAIRQIDRLERIVETYRTKSKPMKMPLKKLAKIRQGINELKSDLELMSIPVAPYDLKKKMNRITSIFNLFNEQVPDANINTIGRTIHNLLAKFGIVFELPAILQVIIRST